MLLIQSRHQNNHFLPNAILLRLRDIRRMGTPLASIGGAGSFDGIFITGIVAVLLA